MEYEKLISKFNTVSAMKDAADVEFIEVKSKLYDFLKANVAIIIEKAIDKEKNQNQKK